MSDQLRPEDLENAFRLMEEKSEQIRKSKAPCGRCETTLVSPAAADQMAERGGWFVCSNCFNHFYIPPPEERDA